MFALHYKNREWSWENILNEDIGEDYILNFCRSWHNGNEFFSFQTSGSTGTPKPIQLSRELLQASAQNSIEFLGLKNIDSALLCINPRFVGGTQMILRAILADYKLYITDASSYPIEGVPQVDFLSLVPLQVQKIISTEEGKYFLDNCKVILIGGATVDPALEKLLSFVKAPVYHSYGMTETASHIALRDMKKSEYYTTLPGITVSLNENGCLVIHWGMLDHKLETTDLALVIDEHHFTILGRADSVINSGAIKISPETLEKVIAREVGDIVPSQSFIISSLPDDTLGEKVVLVTDLADFDWINTLKSIEFDKYHRPREIVYIKEFPLTSSQKVDRKSVRVLIRKK